MNQHRGIEHACTGSEQVYLPEWEKNTDDWEPGLIVAAGMRVVVLAAFRDWNGVPGLDMLYVHVADTGMRTHVIPADLGLAPLTPESRGTEGRMFDTEDRYARALDSCRGWTFGSGHGAPKWMHGDCSGRVGSTARGILCEYHFNRAPALG